MSKYSPLVSIITPSFNQGRFIRDTIESVLIQKKTYPNIEYIVIDGGSTDDTVDILKSYADQIRWISEKDSGQSAAINKGFAMAQGEIVAWLNSDDFYEASAVFQAVEFFRKNTGIKFVHGIGHHVDIDGKFIEKYPSKDCDFKKLAVSCYVCQPTTFWKRELLSDIGYLNENLHYGMDYDYWIRVSKKHKLGFIEKHLANTRVYSDTKTLSDPVKPKLEYIGIVKSHYSFVDAGFICSYVQAKLGGGKSENLFSEIIFCIKMIFMSLGLLLRYNRRIPIKDIKIAIKWIVGRFSMLIKG